MTTAGTERIKGSRKIWKLRYDFVHLCMSVSQHVWTCVCVCVHIIIHICACVNVPITDFESAYGVSCDALLNTGTSPEILNA